MRNIFRRSISYISEKGITAFCVKVLGFFKNTITRIFFYQNHYIFYKNLDDEVQIYPPKLENYEFKVISSIEEFRYLLENGYTLGAPFSTDLIIERLTQGQIAFCIFIDKDLAHFTWVVTDESIISRIEHPPIKMDQNDETLVLGSYTAPKHRQNGIHIFALSQTYAYIKEKYKKKSAIFTVSKDNTSVIKIQTDIFNAEICGQGRLIKILGHIFWKEKELHRDKEDVII